LASLQPAPQNCGAPNPSAEEDFFFSQNRKGAKELWSSRIDCRKHENLGGLASPPRRIGRTRPANAKEFKTKKELHFCNSFIHYEPSRNSTGQACLSNQRPTDYLSHSGLPAVGKTRPANAKEFKTKKGATFL
jgi:hypothetical protein